MTESVKSLADEIQTSVERLVQQFADAGIKKRRLITFPSKKKRPCWPI